MGSAVRDTSIFARTGTGAAHTSAPWAASTTQLLCTSRCRAPGLCAESLDAAATSWFRRFEAVFFLLSFGFCLLSFLPAAAPLQVNQKQLRRRLDPRHR